MAKVIAQKNVSYKELGYIIKPFVRDNNQQAVMYPPHSQIVLPKGSQLSGAKSQNDASRFNTFDDIIRIYALVPQNVQDEMTVDIYVIPTGVAFELPEDAEKLTIVKEKDGQWIWHLYWRINESTF